MAGSNYVIFGGQAVLVAGSINSLVLNVKDYGAKGDGSTDDTAAIQAGINAAAAAECELWFPTGTYITTGSLNCSSTSSVRLVGTASRAGGVSIHYNQSGSGTIINAQSTSYFGISNMSIVATNTGFTGTTVDLSNGQGANFTEVTFAGVSGVLCLHVYLHNTYDISFTNCTWEGCDIGILGPPTSAVMTGTPTITFSSAGHTITRATGSFISDGFVIGQTIVVSGSTSNNGTIGVTTGVSKTVLTFASGVVTEGPDAPGVGITGTLSSFSNRVSFNECNVPAGTINSVWLKSPGNSYTVNNCVLEPLINGKAGAIGGAVGTTAGLVVSGCWFGDDSVTGGYWIDISQGGATITNNTFQSDFSTMIRLTSSQGVAIIGNSFQGCPHMVVFNSVGSCANILLHGNFNDQTTNMWEGPLPTNSILQQGAEGLAGRIETNYWCFRAHLANTQTYLDNTLTTVLADVIDYNPATIYNSGTGTATMVAAGVYQINAVVGMNVSAPCAVVPYIYVNGSQISIGTYAGEAGGIGAGTICDLLYLNVGDTVQIKALQHSGSSATTYQAYFSMHYMSTH